ncbi:ABC transporter permease [Bordetella trematum]|uniref:ABC transporter permease n=1 Tax=Bordetella trematum TaxID=123899 RepID=UPI000D945792|nr:iron chelate uptake ABC transporter family permease subunit [Bordetella trematum]SPU53351.1 iron ABC transporter permease [Bordetella trematum]VDH09075.1 Iron-uptake system permease protein FeuB [Bordetella trematum]
MPSLQPVARPARFRWLAGPLGLAVTCTVLIALCLVSIGLGAGRFSYLDLFGGEQAAKTWQLLMVSRVPRTLALLLAGMALAVAGLLMQMLVRNRYVEPSTAGTMESATLGILTVTLLAPGAPVIVKMVTATVFGLAGSLVFLALLRRVPMRSPFLVPLVGLILGGVIHAVTTYVAIQYDLLQSLHAWTTGDFSGVLRGRYELLWVGLILTCVAYRAADRYTVAGMGREFASNLGLNYARLTFVGLLIVSAISAVVVVTAGAIPFLGLIVPNAVSLMFGDNMRRSIPWVALLGGVFVLTCDIIGRLLLYPYEVPIGTVVGVVGGVLFLWLLLRQRGRRG